MAWGITNPFQRDRSPAPTAPPPLNPGLEQALNVYNGVYGPNLALNDIQQQQLAGQLGYSQAQLGIDQGALQQDTANALAKLGIQQQGMGIDKDAINRQLGVQDRLQQLANQLFGVDSGDIRGRTNLASQLYGFQESELANRLNSAQRGLLSNATARGAVGSSGYVAGKSDLNQQYSIDTDRIKSQRAEDWAQFLRDDQRLGLNQEQSNVGFDEKKAQLKDQLKELDLRAQSLGIDRKALQDNLSQGLQKLGIQNLMTVDTIMNGLLSNDIQRRAIAEQIYRDALSASDFFTNNTGTGGVYGSQGFPNLQRLADSARNRRGASGSW